MIELPQNEIVDLFVEKMKRFATKHKTGNYNRADPTHYEKLESQVWLCYGYSQPGYDPEDELPESFYENLPPDPETVKVGILDCTWGIEFALKTSIGTESAYWSRGIYPTDFDGQGGEWRRPTENFFEVFKRLLIAGDEEPVEDPYGHPSMYI